ncbi:MAG: ABC transporter permease subunit [Deltaproteobacteria bacterium]|jgi:peptide/nickel transport system permease protein/dipeptide transport system permease protein|nr:ABC transporter permease subunit [Deltaproteobacteria bacterium]PNV86750.1 MAG: diguanylate cyclase [Desulfobacteraceae bacterium]MDH3772849.1 ABC transporter permease subunit [Deltaproteobacteria bacterium]MDH3800524.1 ABC transporter permease subunit [Deltaproteobacteria bacterium]MDH3926819.1 ABC transporter permease subunit [Deltaproteobacteria bacterium]
MASLSQRKKSARNPEDRHPFLDQLEQLWRNKTAVAGLLVITLFVLTAILAPFLSPHNPVEASLYDQIIPPIWEEGGTWKNILGTDDLGRDILSRLVYGARVSLVVALATVGIAVFFGSFLGAISGYYKGFLDNIIMRFMDILLAFPHILLAIVIMAYLGPGLTNAMIAIGIIYIPRFARIVRASVLEECEKDYVTASRSVGARDWRIIFVAILPNCLAPLIVQTSLGFASAILDAAALGFLGLGAQPPTPEWGAMIAMGRSHILRAWWVMTFPGIAILFAVLGFNLFGDGLRDALDPRLRD